VVKGYLEAPTCQERVPFILNPEKNRDIFLEYYSRVGCKVKFKSMDSSDCAQPKNNACSVKVRMGVPLGPELSEEEHSYCVAFTPTPKIDWRCSKGYNPVSVLQYKAAHDDGRAAKMRVYAELSDVYLDIYKDAGTKLLSVRLRDVDGGTINGFVDKETRIGKVLSDLLKDKKPHQVALELSYSRRSDDPNAAAILTLYGPTWREFPAEFE
jgi:hypothetical protein